jgi:hypothetical protein
VEKKEQSSDSMSPDMAVLTNLPPEILEQIYHLLGSIDDVHHLGRACAKTHHVIQRRNIYLEIMRSIIYSSPQHRYDFQLCKALKLHRRIVAHIESHGSRLPASHPGAPSLNSWESELRNTAVVCNWPEEWTDDAICDVLARYQGLRILENMWLERELGEDDFLSVDDTSDAQRLANGFEVLVGRDEQFRDGDRASRNVKTPHTRYYSELNADQRGRFYAAVVCVWLLNEIRWVLTNFAYPAVFMVHIDILKSCKRRIAKQEHTPLLDDLDRDAVFSFMYHHLLPLHAPFLADASSSKLPFTYASDFTKDRAHCARYVYHPINCVLGGTQPANILTPTLGYCNSSSWLVKPTSNPQT